MKHLWKLELILFLNCYCLIIKRASSVWMSQGTSRSFQCEAKRDEFTFIQWDLVRKPSQLTTLFKCKASEKPLCEAVTSEKNYEANLTEKLTSYISVLTLSNVILEFQNRTLQCTNSKEFIYEMYNLNVFVQPDAPKCDKVTVNDSVLQIKCLTQKVLPGAICMLYVNTNKTDFKNLKDVIISYKNEPVKDMNYTKTECTYNVSGEILGPGLHEFKSVMFANISSNITEEMKTNSTDNYSIRFAYPKAVLDEDCEVFNSIKEHEFRNCTCYNNNTSDLSTNIMWSNGEEGIFKITTAKLLFLAQRPSKDKRNWRCIISNQMGWTDQIEYNPKVVYGLENVTLTLQQVIDEPCNKKRINISGTCLVSESYPMPTVYININNNSVKPMQGMDKNEYTFQTEITSQGIFNVTCDANNTYTEKRSLKTFTVKGSPDAPKIISIQNDVTNYPNENILPVTEGQSEIICQTKDGFPIEKNLTLKCGPQQNYSIDSDTVLLKLNISSTMNDISCSCNLWHELKCLPNTSDVVLKIMRKSVLTMEEDDKFLIIGISVASALVVLSAIVIFLIVQTDGLWKSKQHQSKTQECEVDNSKLYHRDTGINKKNSLFLDYINIKTTLESAATAPKNLKR